MRRYKEGSITVFLSLILLLVLAIIMTTVEAARVNAANALSLRAFMTGLNSIMAEYYAPLYEEYHVFGLDAGYGSSEINSDKINEKLSGYMEYTFQPDKELTKDSINSAYLKMIEMQYMLESQSAGNSQVMDLKYLTAMQDNFRIHNMYGIRVENTVSERLTSLLDYKGELFEKQAMEYMKYRVPASVVTKFLDDTSVIEDTKKSMEILEEKEKTEAQVQKLDEIILKLMEKVDGVSISKKGIKMNNGQIVIKEFFVKKFLTGSIAMTATGINNEWIYGAVKTHYRDLNVEVNGVIKEVDELIKVEESIESIQNKMLSISQTDTSEMTKDEKEEHEENVIEAINQLDSLLVEKKTLTIRINLQIRDIKNVIEGVLKVTTEAITIIEAGEGIQKSITGKIEDYEELVKSNEGKLGEEFYNSLQEGVVILSQYKGVGHNDIPGLTSDISYGRYDLIAMKHILVDNELILNNILNTLATSLNISNQSSSELRSSLVNFQIEMKSYNAKNINFDYSTVTKPIDSEPYLNDIKELVDDKILELVVENISSISSKVIDKENLPSNLIEDKTTVLTDIKELISGMDLDKGSNLLMHLLSENMVRAAVDSGEKVLNLVLYQEYLSDHFGYYNAQRNTDNKVLNYELEYILKGKYNDSENISEVITQILVTRTGLNLITLLSDGTKISDAKLLAASFIGFTGMPLLVEAVKMIVLTLWAFVESVVDITALLKDRAVPIFKTGKEIQIQLSDILGIDKSLIHKKALNFKEAKTPLTLKYKDYIMLFLFIEDREVKLYRTLDLIQKNLQENYEETFYIKNCIVGLNVSAVFKMDSKFVSIPFVNNYLKKGAGGYQYTFSREYTY